jgi:hypothetical protein
MSEDKINHPKHYKSDAKCSACGQPIECIDITQHMNFNVGNVIKYLWRHGSKNGIEDLQKAKVYIDFEIRRLAGAVEEPADCKRCDGKGWLPVNEDTADEVIEGIIDCPECT